MLRRQARSIIAAAALFTLGAKAEAQFQGSGSVFHISPYVGYMMFDDYLRGPLGTSISNEPSVVYGAQIGLSMSPTVSLIGNLGYTNADVRVGLPIIGGFSVGSSSMLIYDADIQITAPVSKNSALPLSPFIQAGFGAMRYQVGESFLQTEVTNPAFNVGLGADLPVMAGAALRMMAKDYIGKFDFRNAANFGVSGRTAHNWSLSAGVRLDF